MTAFLYTRVSHRDSDKSGISPEEQMAQCEAYLTTVIPDIAKTRIYDGAISAWSKNFAVRPGGRKILEEAVPGDHLVCYSIDRLCRSVRDFSNTMHYFEKAGIHVHFVVNQINSATASGKLQASILAAMAQYTSDLTSERTKEALLIRKLTGQTPTQKGVQYTWAKSELGIYLPQTSDRKHGTIRMYERVSTLPQYTSGLGLQNQTVANLRYSQGLKGDIADAYSDPAVSAFSVKFSKRPAGKRLMEDLQPGDDVVMYRMDRGWRSTADAIETIQQIHDKGAFVHLICEGIRTDTGQGREWISMFASIAQLESQIKSNRTKDAMKRCKATGRPVGLPYFGTKAKQIGETQQRLTIDQKDALLAAQIWVMKNEINLKHAQIEEMLLALKARSLKKPATSNMTSRSMVKRKLGQIDNLIKMMGSSMWSKTLERARKSLLEPFAPEHLRLIRRWSWCEAVQNSQLLLVSQ